MLITNGYFNIDTPCIEINHLLPTLIILAVEVNICHGNQQSDSSLMPQPTRHHQWCPALTVLGVHLTNIIIRKTIALSISLP